MTTWTRGWGAVTTLSSIFAMLLVNGCGSNAPPAASVGGDVGTALDNTRPPIQLSTPAWFYRFDLQLSATGSVSADAAKKVSLRVRPAPSGDAEYLVVAYAGTVVKSAVPISFPRTGLTTQWNPNGGWVHTEFPVTTPKATVFVDADADVDRVVVFDRKGNTIFERKTTDIPLAAGSAAAPSRQPLGDSLGMKPERLTVQDLRARYPSIDFIEPGMDTSQFPSDLLVGATIVTPDANYVDMMANVLDRVSATLFISVRTIGWATYPIDQLLQDEGRSHGSALIINAGKTTTISEAKVAIAHELSHCFAFLSQAFGLDRPTAEWPAEAQLAAREMIEKFHLLGGFERVWWNLQNTGFKSKHARAYSGTVSKTEWQKLSVEEARKGGFASPYGSVDEHEDTGEYIGYLLFPTPENSGICPVFDGKSSVELDVAIPYAKLVLLLATGLIDEQDFKRCVQRADLPTTPGIDFEGWTLDQNLKAGWSSDEKNAYFDVRGARSDSYKILLQARISAKNASPLGLYRFDDIWFGNVGAPGLSGVYLASDSATSARASAGGMVLITKAGAGGSQGAVFGLVLQNALKVDTDQFAMGTFLVP